MIAVNSFFIAFVVRFSADAFYYIPTGFPALANAQRNPRLDRASFSRIHRRDKSVRPRRVVSNYLKLRDSHVADGSESVGDCFWRRAALKRCEEVLAGL